MKKLIFIFLLGLLCTRCQICFEKPLGRYYCSNFDNTENYIDFKENGTYYHFFKNDSIELKNTGRWYISEEDNCIIKLRDFKNFNEDGAQYKDFGIYMLWINHNYLDDGPDGESSTSFEKKR